MSEVQTPINTARESGDVADSGNVKPNEFSSSNNPLDEVSERYSELEKRRQSLGRSMRELRQQIAEEKELWRKEIDLILAKGRERDVSLSTGSTNTDILLSSTSSNHQIDPMFYRSQLPITDNPRSSNLTTPISPNAGLQEVPTRERSYEVPLDDNVIRDYESKISRYQEILAATQAENKNNAKKQLVANAFRRRLQEVENMCTVELMRVRQNISALQPLQNLLSSDWSSYSQDMDGSISEPIDDICGLPDKDVYGNLSPVTDTATDIVENMQQDSIYSSNEGSLSEEDNIHSMDIPLEQ